MLLYFSTVPYRVIYQIIIDVLLLSKAKVVVNVENWVKSRRGVV